MRTRGEGQESKMPFFFVRTMWMAPYTMGIENAWKIKNSRKKNLWNSQKYSKFRKVSRYFQGIPEVYPRKPEDIPEYKEGISEILKSKMPSFQENSQSLKGGKSWKESLKTYRKTSSRNQFLESYKYPEKLSTSIYLVKNLIKFKSRTPWRNQQTSQKFSKFGKMSSNLKKFS